MWLAILIGGKTFPNCTSAGRRVFLAHAHNAVTLNTMPLRFESPAMLVVGLALTTVAVATMVWRRPALPLVSRILVLASLLLWTAAVGKLQWIRGDRAEVAVMVDLSPSTRTATFRRRELLQRRIHELLGNIPHRITFFADGNRDDDGRLNLLADMPCDATVFVPPFASAVLLFSDAQFELPTAAPPTYPVIDPALESPPDASISRLTLRSDDAVADVKVAGGVRRLTFHGVANGAATSIQIGSYSIRQPVKSDVKSVGAEFGGADPWPENDALAINVPPPDKIERWWVGGAPPPGWIGVAAASLPSELTDYLAPAIIAMNNVPADAIGPSSQDRLRQYVRELGGGLLIFGGDHAFAAGDYVGSALEALSPLASTPPGPATRWVILIDGSGSMATETSPGATQWEVASRAARSLLPHLRPRDLLSLGSFADGVTWWSNGKSVSETATLAIPPIGVAPAGPTNLQRAMEDILHADKSPVPTQLIIITDGDAQLTGIDGFIADMKKSNIRLQVLAIGSGSAIPDLRRIAAAVGGRVSDAQSAATWAEKLQDLCRAAMDSRLQSTRIHVAFDSAMHLPASEKSNWNRTWIKAQALPLAEVRDNTDTWHPVARWQAGQGRVLSAAFTPTTVEVEAFTRLIARPPTDPRFVIRWDADSRVTVTVDAIDGRQYLNGERLSLELIDEVSSKTMTMTIPQIAPGRYQISMSAPRAPSFAAVRRADQVLGRTAIAGRYPPEFDGIGNDHPAMHELARRTGGEVVDIRRTTPLALKRPPRLVPLMSWLMAAGAFTLACALIWGNMRHRLAGGRF